MRVPIVKLHSKKIANQNGAVLAVALIILFLLSILGLAVMKTSSLEEKMAANSLHHDIVFQAAETASESAIRNSQNMSDAFDSDDQTIDVSYSHEKLPHITADSSVSFVGEYALPGDSVTQGSGITGFLFTATSVGSIDEAHTSTTIIQGFSRRVPSAE